MGDRMDYDYPPNISMFTLAYALNSSIKPLSPLCPIQENIAAYKFEDVSN
ncbi:hypothetical protein AVEN_214515-1, partial [Araneus ventricosus]